MRYFVNVHNLDELRKLYKELLKKFHPDNGGSTAATQEINAEYKMAFDLLKSGKTYTGTTTTEEKTDYSDVTDELIREAIQRIIILDVNIEIVGCWIWVDGNTYPVKDDLKKAGFMFSGKRKKWYWHAPEQKKKYHKNNMTYEEIQQKYGTSKVKNSHCKIA